MTQESIVKTHPNAMQSIGTHSLPMTGPMRISNRNFMEEFHKIYHGQEEKDEFEIKGQSKGISLSGFKTGHG